MRALLSFCVLAVFTSQAQPKAGSYQTECLDSMTPKGGRKTDGKLSRSSSNYLIRNLAREIDPGESAYLDDEREKALVIQYRTRQDHRAFKRIAAAYIVRLENVINQLLYKWKVSRNTTFIEQDLMQEGMLYFLEEIEKYDLDQSVSFGNFVFKYLPHRLNRVIYTYLAVYRIPVHIQEDKTKDSSIPTVINITGPNMDLPEKARSGRRDKKPVTFDESLPDKGRSQEENAQSDGYVRFIHSLLAGSDLTFTEKQVFTHRLLGKSFQKIAEAMRVQKDAAYETYVRAVNKLKNEWKNRGFTQEDF